MLQNPRRKRVAMPTRADLELQTSTAVKWVPFWTLSPPVERCRRHAWAKRAPGHNNQKRKTEPKDKTQIGRESA